MIHVYYDCQCTPRPPPDIVGFQPFSGIYLHHSEVGMYHCVCCAAPLFRYQWEKVNDSQLRPECKT